VKCVVATSALGMGYDKPDLGFVVHFQGPGSPIAYYQQVGRAGRGLTEADAVLLRGAEDREIQDFFIKSAFPPPEKVEAVLELIEAASRPITVGGLMNEINLGKGRLSLMLKQLEVEGAVRKVGSGYKLGGRGWSHDGERIAAVTAARRTEQKAMEAYGNDGRCLMESLRIELDDPGAEPCGRCSVCTEPRFDGELDPELVQAATAMLRSRPIEIEPRRSTPTAAGGFSKLPREQQSGPGRALALLSDASWGRQVKEARVRGERLDEELVDAAAALLGEWAPDPAPAWICPVPSARNPELVPDFAARLAEKLGLPWAPALRLTRETEPQAGMDNSRQQYLNVQGAFAVDRDAVPTREPVLLLDDTVDSRWTLTEAGAALRRAGVVAVWPFALASSGLG
jgi:ATP-dependent DNA helicase RecQ